MLGFSVAIKHAFWPRHRQPPTTHVLWGGPLKNDHDVVYREPSPSVSLQGSCRANRGWFRSGRGIFGPPVLYGGFCQVKKRRREREPCQDVSDEDGSKGAYWHHGGQLAVAQKHGIPKMTPSVNGTTDYQCNHSSVIVSHTQLQRCPKLLGEPSNWMVALEFSLRICRAQIVGRRRPKGSVLFWQGYL